MHLDLLHGTQAQCSWDFPEVATRKMSNRLQAEVAAIAAKHITIRDRQRRVAPSAAGTSIQHSTTGGVMAEDALSQNDAEILLRMEKVPASPDAFRFPDLGGRIEVPLMSPDERERFSLDINRKRIALTTGYQARGRQVVVLARLDFAAPHRNPDGTEVGVPHLHLYREGYGDKWAVEIPEGLLSKPEDAWQVLHDFMKYCGVVEQPNIVRGLFS